VPLPSQQGSAVNDKISILTKKRKDSHARKMIADNNNKFHSFEETILFRLPIKSSSPMTSIRTHLESLDADTKQYHGDQNPRSKSLFQLGSDSIAKCLFRRSIETCPPMISGGAPSKAGVGREEIFRNLKLWTYVKLGKREEEEKGFNAREVKREEVASRDTTMEWLSVQIAQRDTLIKQLEHVVSQQQKLLEKTLLTSEDSKPVHGERSCARLEGRDFEEILNAFQHRLAERKKKREYITKRRMEIKQIIKELL
jgi:hypothetical protein